jgi:hypothetical protein
MNIILLIVAKKLTLFFYWLGKLKSGYKYDTLIVSNYDYLSDCQSLLLERLDMEDLSNRFLYNVEKKNYLSKLIAYQKCAFLAAKAKNIIIFDYCFPIFCIKKSPEQKIFQLWHANGIFKRFGMPNFFQKHGEKLAKKFYSIVPIHSNYDYIFLSNEKCIPYFMEAFNDYNEEKYMISNSIFLDLFVEKAKEKNYVKSEKKINVLLAKTFNHQSETSVYDLLTEYLYDEAEKYGVTVNVSTLLHPKLASNYDKIDVMANCDLLITDYSSVCFEASAIGKDVAFLRGPQKSDVFVEVAKKVYYNPQELATDILERNIVDNNLNEYLSLDGAKQIDIIIDLIKQNNIPKEIVTPVVPAGNISIGS